ncbi:NEW3 domain-containing protein [Halomicrobium urmianum]|uniref:NEW3 domain-containing protein n=1 Tax=Halomicrobium urmianum TaxID=1586233 RepID=UPI001CD920C8|nr:NEW3 domain-containing protein [Halomicrobium urmianum]
MNGEVTRAGLAVAMAVLLATAPVAGAVSAGQVAGGATVADAEQTGGTAPSVSAASVDGRIVDFRQQSGEFTAGESVAATATVENTGTTTHTFFVGYAAVDPDGTYRENDGTTGRTVTLAPGERTTVSLEWAVESDAPAGYYDGYAALWKESDRDDLRTRLDDARRSDGFRVAEETIDAQIGGVDVDAGEFDDGETVDATATVENTGNVDHTYFVGYSVVGPDGELYDNDETTGKTVTLAPGERRTVSLSWTVESDAPAGEYDGFVAVWEESDRDDLRTRLDSARRSDAFGVAEPTEVDARLVGFDVDSGEHRAGETVDATATVENTGNVDHTYFVGYSVVGPDGELYDNDASTGRTVTLAPGERHTVSLEWDVESDAPAGEYDGYAAVWKESDRDNLRTRLDAARRSDAFGVAEPPEVDAEIVDASVGGGEFTPGETVDATATVENTGNVDHTYFVGYSVVGPDGELYDNDETTGKTVTLAPGEQRVVDLELTVEDGAPTGSYGVRLSAWQESDRDDLRTRLDDVSGSDVFEVVDDAGARIVDFDVERGEFAAGESVDARAVVENTGASHHTFFVGYSAIGPDGEEYDGDASTGRTVTLAPGERRTVSLSWRVEDDAPGGEYDGYAAVWKESDRDDLRTRLDDERRRGAFEVLGPGDVDARIAAVESRSETYAAGDTAVVDVRVDNDGPIEHTFLVRSAFDGPDGGPLDETERTVTVGPGETDVLRFETDLPVDAPVGAYAHEAIVFANRTSDRALDAERAEPIFRVGDGGAELTGVASSNPEYEPGDQVLLEATVENRGATEETYEVRYRIEHGDGPGTTVTRGDRLTLAPGESGTAEVSWTTEARDPNPVEPGAYDVAVEVVDSDVGESVATARRSGLFEVREPEEQIGVRHFDVADGAHEPLDDLPATTRVTSRDDEKRYVRLVYEVRTEDGWQTLDEQTTDVLAEATTTVERDLPVPEYLNAGSYDLRVTVRGADTEKYLYARSVIEDALTVETGDALVVEATDASGEPVPGTVVGINADGGRSKVAGQDGTVRFAGLSSGTYSVTVYPGTEARVSRVVEYDAAATEEVSITVGDAASVSGKVTLFDGTVLRDVTVEIDGHTARTDDDGEFAFDEELATGSTTAVVRASGDTLGRYPIIVEEGVDSYHVRIENDEPVQDPSSFALGALCGLGCWPEGVDDKSEYTAGWIASGFVAAGDVRDFLVALDTGQGGEAALAAFGIIPLAGDVGSAMPKISKLRRAGSLGERLQLQRILGRIDQFRGNRVRAVNRLYDGTPGTYLDETLGLSTEAIERLMKNERNVGRIADSARTLLDEYGLSRETVRQYVKSGRDPEDLQDAAESLRYADESADVSRRVDGAKLDDVENAGDLAEVTASKRLAKAENARVAKSFNQLEDLEDGTYVLQGFESSAVQSGDVDAMVVAKQGDTVTVERIYEVYSGGNPGTAVSKTSQLSQRLGDVTGRTDEFAEGTDLTVEASDDVTGSMYVPDATATKTYERAANEGDSAREAIQRKGYDVETFDRTSDQFKQDFDAVSNG